MVRLASSRSHGAALSGCRVAARRRYALAMASEDTRHEFRPSMLYTSMLTGGRRLDGEEEGFVRGRRERVVDVNVDANSPDAAAPVEIQDKAKDED